MKKNHRFQFDLRTLLLCVLLFCAVIMVGRLVLWPALAPFTAGYWKGVSDIYALWQTEEMISLNLAKEGAEVPTCWEDLSDEYRATNQSYNTSDLSSLQDRVSIDFAVLNKAGLAQSPPSHDAAKTIIRLRSASGTFGVELTEEEQKVNERLHQSLRAYPGMGSDQEGDS